MDGGDISLVSYENKIVKTALCMALATPAPAPRSR